MPSWKLAVGSPSLPMPRLPVATPRTRAVFGVEHLGRGKAGKDLDAERLGLRREPAHDVAEADDVVAVVVEAVGQERVRRRRRAGLGEEEEAVAGDRLVERRAVFLPVGQQLGRSRADP